MVAGELGSADLRKKRFFKRKNILPTHEEGSQYGWLVVDSLGEHKPQPVIYGKDADAIARKLNRMHSNEVKARRSDTPKSRRARK